MADSIKVDTARVSAAAKTIGRYNQTIRDDFSSVESAIKSLNGSWDGAASEKAMDSFHRIKNNFSEPRYQVVNNYVKFLHEVVDPGYTQTEITNTKLADAFK